MGGKNFMFKGLMILLITLLTSSFLSIPGVPVYASAQNSLVSEKVGVTHVAGLYNFTSQDFLSEGAGKLNELGTKTIKLWLTPGYRDVYSFNSSWPDASTMVELAQTQYFSNVFSGPFKNYVLEAYEFSAYDWRYGLNQYQINDIKNQFYLLAKYLMQTYENTGKTFVLQNWEGDNAIRLDLLTTDQERQTAIQGMIDWLNARQDGIAMARNELGAMGVNVYGAVEVNKISTTLSGASRIIDVVVPYTHADLYSYSNWETGTNAGQLWDNLTYIAAKAPDSAAFGSKNVFMGEFGAAENQVGGEQNQLLQTKTQLETALAWGVQYAIYWELYCNEKRTGFTGRPENADVQGFWLIRPDGTYAPVWDYLKTMCKQTMVYDSCDNWDNTYSHTANLTFDSSNQSYFENDGSRMTRTSDTVESCTYYSGGSTYDITDFRAAVYYYASVADRFKVYASADNSTWTQLAVTNELTANTGDFWYRTVFRPGEDIPVGTRYLKYELSNDVNTWTPQLSQSVIYIAETGV